MELLFNDSTNKDSSQSLISEILNSAVIELNQPKNLEAEILIVDEDEIREINANSRGIDKVTDVLSFPMLDLKAGEIIREEKFSLEMNLETGNIFLGSIVICLTKAKQQSEEFGHSFEREVAYLALHGLLHLLGYDHEKENDKEIMREAEEKILTKLNFLR